METLLGFLRRAASWFSGHRRDDGIAEELEAHRLHTQEELERAGMTRAQAESESRKRMGNVTLAREDSRDVWIVRWADQLRQHLRYGVRGLRRERGFALTAIATLALGIAAATTAFCIVDGEIWRALPFPNARRLMLVRSGIEGDTLKAGSLKIDAISIQELLEWRERMPAMAGLAAMGRMDRRTSRADRAESLLAAEVSANYFEVLGRPVLLGRALTSADAGTDAVVLNERGWRRAFDADPAIVGRTFLIDDTPAVVVGVVETNDSMSSEPDIFTPFDERPSGPRYATPQLYGIVGLLRPGATASMAAAQMQGLLNERARSTSAGAPHKALVEDLSTFYAQGDRAPMYFLLGAALIVLALTLVNVAGLHLARSLKRAPEFALRGALGGGAGSITAQLFVESALIAIPSALIGMWLTAQAVAAASAVLPAGLLLRGTHIRLDPRAALCAVLIAFGTTAVLALVPRGLARRANLAATLGAAGRSSTGSSGKRLRGALLVAQLALTVMLIVGAGVFVRSFTQLMQVPLGFDAADGWSVRVSPSGPRYESAAAQRAYAESLVERVRALPGVRASAVATSSPLRSGPLAMMNRSGDAALPKSKRGIFRAVGDGYFEAVGTPIIRGRALALNDVAGAPRVAVVNREAVRQLFGDANPIGQSIDIASVTAPWAQRGAVTIVGVADNVKNIGLNEQSMPDIYVPFAQQPSPRIEIIVRGRGGDASMPLALRDAAAAVDRTVAAPTVTSIDDRVRVATQGERFNLFLVSIFAALAVIIATIGTYGSMSYWAATHAREFSVRAAIGASPRSLLLHALSQAGRLGVWGGVLGIAATFAFAAWIGDALYFVAGEHNGLLYNVSTTDPVSLTIAFTGVMIVALAAGYLPARRSARIDPVRVLRGE